MVGICSGTVDLLVLRTSGISNVKDLKQFFSDQTVVQSWPPPRNADDRQCSCVLHTSLTAVAGHRAGAGKSENCIRVVTVWCGTAAMHAHFQQPPAV